MSHLFSHHKTLLDGVALVPLRMLNAYPPSSCPVTQVDFDPANGEWRWELTGHTLVIPGYEYGPAEYLGWNESPGPSNWVPYPPQVQVVDEDGNELEVRDQTAEEALEEYKDLVKQKGLPYDPLLLRTDGTPPSTAPGTEYAVNTKLSAEDKKKADWQWWSVDFPASRLLPLLTTRGAGTTDGYTTGNGITNRATLASIWPAAGSSRASAR